MQVLTHETVFAYIVWPIRRTVRRVHYKKRHNFTQPFDLQGHARMQIFTYNDVSVCNVSSPNYHMFHVSVLFPRKYHDSVMCMHKFTH